PSSSTCHCPSRPTGCGAHTTGQAGVLMVIGIALYCTAVSVPVSVCAKAREAAISGNTYSSTWPSTSAQSPKAKIFSSEVRKKRSTTTPRSTSSPAARARSTLGCKPTADNTTSASIVAPSDKCTRTPCSSFTTSCAKGTKWNVTPSLLSAEDTARDATSGRKVGKQRPAGSTTCTSKPPLARSFENSVPIKPLPTITTRF